MRQKFSIKHIYSILVLPSRLHVISYIAMSDRHEKYCRDFREGGQAFTCEYFTPPSNPDAPYYCRECQHGFSKHPEALDSTSRTTPRRQEGTELSGKKRLVSIFKKKTSLGSAVPTATSSKNILDQRVDVEQASVARDEVMKGFRVGLHLQTSKVNKVRNTSCTIVILTSWSRSSCNHVEFLVVGQGLCHQVNLMPMGIKLRKLHHGFFS